ncbi:MAG: hypothetical protein PQJ46_09530, partial [Spirochaetales bacterium]|nr:hypothetical protein [Spirochaetales bacterium]
MSDILTSTLKKLKKLFIVYLAIAVLLFAFDIVFHKFCAPVTPLFFSLKLWGYFLFVISLITGVAVPILLRTNFHKHASITGIATLEGYLRLQKLLLFSAFISTLAADIAYFFPVNSVYLYVSV